MTPTIKDVAREAGVSIATVSYVLNNKNTAISADTRRHVLEIAARIGYRPNATARNLRSNQTRLIGWAWDGAHDQFAYAMAQSAEAANYHLLTFTFSHEDVITSYDEIMRTGRVDGFVLSGSVTNEALVRFLLDRRFPFVSYGRTNAAWEFPWVETDGRAGIRCAVEHLISLGHKKIALAAWSAESFSGDNRIRGYVEAMDNARLPIPSAYILRLDDSESAGREAMSYWADLPADEQPTAVVAVSDLMAIGVMNAAVECGYKIGKTLSVIGFGNTPMTEYLRPALTTLQPQVQQICDGLMTMLESILSKQEPETTHILIPPALIIRNSTGAPQPK